MIYSLTNIYVDATFFVISVITVDQLITTELRHKLVRRRMNVVEIRINEHTLLKVTNVSEKLSI